MSKKLLCAAILGTLCAAGTLPADNNFVKTLPVTAKDGVSEFAMPGKGWVYLEGVGDKDVTLNVGGKAFTVAPRKGAAMIRLPQGKVTVNGKVAKARRVGENLFYKPAGDYSSDKMYRVTTDKTPSQSGRPGLYLYHWNYLNENILEPFNTLGFAQDWNPAIDQWVREGRIVIRDCSIRPKGDENLAIWNKISEDKRYEGVMPDEFVIPAGRKSATDAGMGYNNPGSGFQADIFEAIQAWGKAHPDKRFFAWVGLPWDCLGEDVAPLLKALSPDGAIMWEAYTHVRDFDNELKIRLANRSKQFKKLKGDLKDFRLVLGTYEFLDSDYAYDFKVALDTELNMAANSPDFRGIGGAGLWAAHYTTPEMLRWYAALVKHYAVDGEKSMLSEKYGFKLKPGIIQNPEWQTLDGVEIIGNVDLIASKDCGIPAGYLPKSRTNLLRFKRNEDAENLATITLNSLQKGKLYAVDTLAVNPANDGTMADYAFTLRVDGAEEVSHEVRRLTDFVSQKQVFNAHQLVFRANAPMVKLVIGDGAEDAGGEKPEVLLVDSLRVTPYFE